VSEHKKKTSVNLEDEITTAIRDSIALHPDGPQNVSEFVREACLAKLVKDRAKIEALRKLREEPTDPPDQ
jgi:Arc/MetJ-type ribon-helix-helix transcriptional regulator